MDNDVMKLLAHLDQTRADLREVLREMPDVQAAVLIKTCAAGRFDELDDPQRLLAGLLAVAAIFELRALGKED